jgi:hypothetical protein
VEEEEEEEEEGLVIALRPQTPKHNRGGWSHYVAMWGMCMQLLLY